MKLTDHGEKILFCIMAPMALCGVTLALDGKLFWATLIALAMALITFITNGDW